jgi:hypothetical protein
VKRSVLWAVMLALSSCSGGGSSAPSAVTPVTGFDSTARDAAQGALLAEQSVSVGVSGGPSFLSGRRTSSRSPRAAAVCSGGFTEQDTTTGANTHSVVSLYFDSACTMLRQSATLDFSNGIDTSSMTGTIVSSDTAGHVTGVRTLTGSEFASGGGFRNRQSVDATSASATPFGHTNEFCALATLQCTLAATVTGPAFEIGVVLAVTLPPLAASGETLTLPFSGSLSAAGPGAITILQPSPFAAPVLAGAGTPAVTIAGSVTVTLGVGAPTAFTLSMNVGSTHADGTLANGTTTFAVAGGTTATVNANGDGSIRYANGATEAIVDFRIVG